MKSTKNPAVVGLTPIRLDENSSAVPSYVLQRELAENTTRSVATATPLTAPASPASSHPEQPGR
jgi:hypothetical protein